jgi:hypothetical protein
VNPTAEPEELVPGDQTGRIEKDVAEPERTAEIVTPLTLGLRTFKSAGHLAADDYVHLADLIRLLTDMEDAVENPAQVEVFRGLRKLLKRLRDGTD